MEKGNEPPTSTTDTNQMAPPYPGTYPQGAPLPDGYYSGGVPPPAYPAGPQYQPPPAYPAGAMTTQTYYPGQTQPPVIVQQQPNMVVVGQYGGMGGIPPPDYQALAWFACLCCCWPVGLAAIIKSNEVRNACARGDYATARMASQSARTLSMVSIGLGIAFLVLYIIVLVVWLIPLLAYTSSYNYN